MDYKNDMKVRYIEKSEGPGCFQQFYEGAWHDVPVVSESSIVEGVDVASDAIENETEVVSVSTNPGSTGFSNDTEGSQDDTQKE